MCEIGDVFSGYCNGYFGRDSYGDKSVEALGIDWILCREDGGGVVLATFSNNDEMIEMVERWKAET